MQNQDQQITRDSLIIILLWFPKKPSYRHFINRRRLYKIFYLLFQKIKATFSYAPGKWTIKELLQHLIDAERIFSYRALCFSRKEKQVLPGFEEKEYAANSNANERSWQSLANEFLIVRQSTLSLFNSFSNEMLAAEGKANNYLISVTAIGFVTIGHLYHHMKIVEERYK